MNLRSGPVKQSEAQKPSKWGSYNSMGHEVSYLGTSVLFLPRFEKESASRLPYPKVFTLT